MSQKLIESGTVENPLERREIGSLPRPATCSQGSAVDVGTRSHHPDAPCHVVTEISVGIFFFLCLITGPIIRMRVSFRQHYLPYVAKRACDRERSDP